MDNLLATYDSITVVAKQFYQLQIEQGIKHLAQVANLIMTTLEQYQATEEDVRHVQALLNDCMAAYQNKEYILLADLIQYELAPIFAPR